MKRGLFGFVCVTIVASLMLASSARLGTRGQQPMRSVIVQDAETAVAGAAINTWVQPD